MTEIHSLSGLEDELKRLSLDLSNAPIAEKERIGAKILSLTEQKISMSRRLDQARAKMHSAAETAEKFGVGTGGKGSQED